MNIRSLAVPVVLLALSTPASAQRVLTRLPTEGSAMPILATARALSLLPNTGLSLPGPRLSQPRARWWPPCFFKGLDKWNPQEVLK